MSKRDIVFLGHTDIQLEESVCVHEVCECVCVCGCKDIVIPLESQWGGCEAGEYPV